MNENIDNQKDLTRYSRQMVFEPLGLDSQRAMAAARVLIVGVGGLGSWTAELLARAGIGSLRLVDDDKVELTNIHRQAFYDESDAKAAVAKVAAAAMHIGQINSSVAVEPIAARLDAGNIESLAEGVDVILDGTDNFATRYLINDFCVKHGISWVFAGVIAAEAQTMTIVPGKTPCLRCVLETPPPPCSDPNCRTNGVLGPAVAAISSFQACEAIKIVTGKLDCISPYLLKLDLWSNQQQRIDVCASGADPDCICCNHKSFEFLEP